MGCFQTDRGFVLALGDDPYLEPGSSSVLFSYETEINEDSQQDR
jgi:hypothetical protein